MFVILSPLLCQELYYWSHTWIDHVLGIQLNPVRFTWLYFYVIFIGEIKAKSSLSKVQLIKFNCLQYNFNIIYFKKLQNCIWDLVKYKVCFKIQQFVKCHYNLYTFVTISVSKWEAFTKALFYSLKTCLLNHFFLLCAVTKNLPGILLMECSVLGILPADLPQAQHTLQEEVGLKCHGSSAPGEGRHTAHFITVQVRKCNGYQQGQKSEIWLINL